MKDEVPFLCRSVGSPSCKEVDALKGVGLSLGVVAVQQIDPRIKGDPRTLYIAEIGVTDVFYDHNLLYWGSAGALPRHPAQGSALGIRQEPFYKKVLGSPKIFGGNWFFV